MAPGTGTPEPGGMTSRELLEAVRRICLELPVVGIDVVEVAPPFDSADITAILANRVVLESAECDCKATQWQHLLTNTKSAGPLIHA
jgi:arginase family enzyme